MRDRSSNARAFPWTLCAVVSLNLHPEIHEMKKLPIILTCLAVLCCGAHADTSYFLLQGPFGPGDSVNTYKWKVLYQPGSLTTGQDLLNTIFGVPTDAGIKYSDAFGGSTEVYKSSNSGQGAQYLNFGSSSAPSLFAISFTIQGDVILQDSSFSPGWNYNVAGGGGSQSYPSGSWTYSQDGAGTRLLADGSFDGWNYGATFPADAIAGPENSPAVQNFANATVINVVPEPASATFLLAGALVIGMRRRRR